MTTPGTGEHHSSCSHAKFSNRYLVCLAKQANAENCPLPKVAAYDHHDGQLDIKNTVYLANDDGKAGTCNAAFFVVVVDNLDSKTKIQVLINSIKSAYPLHLILSRFTTSCFSEDRKFSASQCILSAPCRVVDSV
jgi:hypothetical protein